MLTQFGNKQVRHMFDEIDYILEAQHAEKFASLYASIPSKFSKFSEFALNLFCISISLQLFV